MAKTELRMQLCAAAANELMYQYVSERGKRAGKDQVRGGAQGKRGLLLLLCAASPGLPARAALVTTLSSTHSDACPTLAGGRLADERREAA